MITYKELVEQGMKPEEARKYLLGQKPTVIQRKTSPRDRAVPLEGKIPSMPPLEKYAPPPEKAVTKEPISERMSIADLSRVLGRLEDGPEYIKELVAEFDGKRVRVVRGLRKSPTTGETKHGYYIKFESLTPPRVLHEMKGARDPGEVKHWHEILRGSYSQLEVSSRWDSEGDKWVFEGSVPVPKDIWRWDVYEAAKEIMALKPTRMELVTFKRRIPGREILGVFPRLRLRLTPVPEYLTGEE